MNAKEEYKLNVQNLMELIPTAVIAKQIDSLEDTNGKIVDKHIRWVVSDYVAVYSGIRYVYSIGQNFEETFKFILKMRDYKNFVAACEARRKELFGKGVDKIK